MSRYDATVRALVFCWAMSRWQKNSRTSAGKPGIIVVEFMEGLRGREK